MSIITGYSDVAFNVEPGLPGTWRMNPVVRDSWADALESGAYLQGTNRLVSAADVSTGLRRYCCLGVLCDLAVHAEVVEFSPTFAHYETVVDGNVVVQDACQLPEVVARWAALWTSDPHVLIPAATIEGTKPLRLSVLNDLRKYYFRAIAELIRTYL